MKPQLSIEENKQIVCRIVEEGLSRQNLGLINEYFDPDFIESQFDHKLIL